MEISEVIPGMRYGCLVPDKTTGTAKVVRPTCIAMKIIEDYGHEKLWRSVKPYTQSDWPVWFYVRMMYTDEFMSDDEVKKNGKYLFSIILVSPEAVRQNGPDTIEKALEQRWYRPEERPATIPDEELADMLRDYGTAATLKEWYGNNERKGLAAARATMAEIQMLFGFWMDRICNGIGNTHWDWLMGVDIIKVAMARHKPNSPEQVSGAETI